MDIYKEASKEKLRIQTTKGPLAPEQIRDLSIPELDTLAVDLQAEYEKSGKKSFLVAKSSKDKIAKLRFDIVLDILNDKVEEETAAKQKKEDKEHNEKIFAIIEQKQDAALGNKTIAQLKKELR